MNSRELVAVPIVLLCALLADALAQSSPEKAVKPEAKAVLDKVRETYRNLAGYHFKRVLLLQEGREDGKLANIAELTLAIASEQAKPVPDSGPFPPVNLDRFRMGTKTKRSEMLQTCDGRICGSYTSLKNEYMTGQRFREVNTSVGGSLMLGVHLFGFMTLEEEALQDAKVAREEVVEVGKERRNCYVTDSFTTARIEGLPADLFHFTPPEGAKQVPNVASRREKQ